MNPDDLKGPEQQTAFLKTVYCYNCHCEHHVDHPSFTCKSCGAPNWAHNWEELLTDEERAKSLKEDREKREGHSRRMYQAILPLFRKKYDELAKICPGIAPFEDAPISEDPADGWMQIFPGHGILMMPEKYTRLNQNPQCQTPPYEGMRYVGGPIFRRWMEEGGIRRNGLSGNIGYPLSDPHEDTDLTTVQEFEKGWIRMLPSGETEVSRYTSDPTTFLGRLFPTFACFFEKDYGHIWMHKYRTPWSERRNSK